MKEPQSSAAPAPALMPTAPAHPAPAAVTPKKSHMPRPSRRKEYPPLFVRSLCVVVRDKPHKVAWAARYRVANLAVLCELPVRRLRRRWVREFGVTPKRWLLRERAIYAKWLANQSGALTLAAHLARR